METKTIINLLNDSSNEESEFATIKWYVIVKQQKTGSSKTILSNSRQKLPSKHSSWWRRLQDVFIKMNMFASALCLQKMSSRRLQDVLAKTNIFFLAIRLQDVFKTYSRRLQDVLQKRLQDIFKMSSRRFEYVLKTSSKCLQDVLPRRLQDILKNVFKRFWRRLQDVFQRYLQDVSKTLRRIQHVSQTFFSKDDYLQRDMPR